MDKTRKQNNEISRIFLKLKVWTWSLNLKANNLKSNKHQQVIKHCYIWADILGSLKTLIEKREAAKELNEKIAH